MKFLFNILSTICISFSFSGLKTNLNLDITGINNWNIQLSIQEVRQEEENYCAPAVAASFIEFQTGQIFTQEYLAYEMHVDAQGASPSDLGTTIINHLYGHLEIYVEPVAQHFGVSIADITLLSHIIYSSLLKSAPVIIGINGTLPWWGPHVSPISHYVLIYGIRGDINDPINLIYIVMDPADGSSHVLTALDISTMFTSGNGCYFAA